MAIKTLSSAERKSLIEYHSRCIQNAFMGVMMPDKVELLDHAQRITELVKSLPKHDFAIVG